MPKIDIDMFDDTPHVGDHVKVMGKIEDINEDTGEVEVSYDDVKIVDKDKKPSKRRNRRDNNDDDVVVMEDQMMPNTQTVDQALGQAFPSTQ